MLSKEENTYNWKEVANLLQLGFGRNTLIKILRELGLLDYDNYPYQSYFDSGYFVVRIKPRPAQPHKSDVVVLTTDKGLGFLSKKLANVKPSNSSKNDE
jgi:hypothetical protein